jgi:hypothetical protein
LAANSALEQGLVSTHAANMIYADYDATTSLDPEVRAAMNEAIAP